MKNHVHDAESKHVKPTLFIGLGGTGAEIIMRLRRRIVSEFWGKNGVRLDTISEFPAARFLHFDLDLRTMSGTEQSSDADPLSNAVKLLLNERIVDFPYLVDYLKSNRTQHYPHINNWFPSGRLRDLQIDDHYFPSHVRAISRLCFYDRFTQIRTAVEEHLCELKAGVSHQTALTRLGLETGADRRVVIIASGAGGTGSGSFLDMGFLAKALNVSPTGPVDLILFLPSGYSGANQQATEANSYAALMELDACMSNSVRYVHPQYGWGPEHEDILPGAEARPFDSMFLVDTKNMADVVTNNVRDVFHMIADILFEDFMPGDFADIKRSIDVNQQQLRSTPYYQSITDGDDTAKEMYPRAYSSIGQCTLESPQNLERFVRHLRESQDRVRALFQIMDNSQDYSPSVKENIDGMEIHDELSSDLMDKRAHVRATLDILGAMVRRAEEQQKESYAMRITLPVAEEVPTLDFTDPEVIKDWAETVFGVTGSEEIFDRLKTQSDRLSFVNKMLDYADHKDSDLPNIRISDLMKKMDSAQRLEQLRQLLRRAMPWGGLNKAHLKSDNYVVLVASGDSEFAKRYGEEAKQSLPGIGINSDRVQFSPLSAQSEQGKVLAYVQVDGFPLDNFQDLRRWRTSYRQVIQKLPVHTSKLARYRHPVIPTPDERREMKASLKIFYAAVMLGALQRNAADGIYTGVFEGSRLGCGTEVIRRNDSFAPDRLQDIGRMVQEQKSQLKTPAQRRAALIAWQYYLKAVYPKKPMGDGGGNDQEIKGQASLYCEQLQKEWAREWEQEAFLRDTVNAKVLFTEGDLVTPLLETFQMAKWVDFLPGSREDADPAEVNVRVQRDKCVLKPEVFEPDWLEQHVDYFRSPVQGTEGSSWGGQAGVVEGQPVGTPPPPPPPPGGVCFQADGNGWLSPLLGGTLVNLGWHGGQAFWLPAGGQPIPVPQITQAAQVPPPPGAGLIWSTDASGWQQPAWQSAPGVPPAPAKLGWYGNPHSPTPCWIAGGQSIPFTLAVAPVAATPPPPLLI